MGAHTEERFIDRIMADAVTSTHLVDAVTSTHSGVGGDPDKTKLAECNLPALDGEPNAEGIKLLRDLVIPLTVSASPLLDSGEVGALGSGEANVEHEESAVLVTSRPSLAATAPEHRPTQREEASGNGQTGEGSDGTDLGEKIVQSVLLSFLVGLMVRSVLPIIKPTLIEGIEACKALLEAMWL